MRTGCMPSFCPAGKCWPLPAWRAIHGGRLAYGPPFPANLPGHFRIRGSGRAGTLVMGPNAVRSGEAGHGHGPGRTDSSAFPATGSRRPAAPGTATAPPYPAGLQPIRRHSPASPTVRATRTGRPVSVVSIAGSRRRCRSRAAPRRRWRSGRGRRPGGRRAGSEISVRDTDISRFRGGAGAVRRAIHRGHHRRKSRGTS